jgi:transposase
MTPSYCPTKFEIFIGLDVSRDSFCFTAFDHYRKLLTKTIPSDPMNLINYIKNHHKDQSVICAYEAGPTGFGLYDALATVNIPCLVVAPTSIAQKPNQRIKNDRVDSVKLANFLRQGELSSVHIPTGAYRELRHLVKSYQMYITQRTSAKRRIKALLLFTSAPKPDDDIKHNWSRPYLKYLKTVDCPDYIRQRLDMLLADLDYARQQSLQAILNLRQFAKANPDINQQIQYLDSIDGIGFIVACCLLARIGDPSEISSCRQLGSFLGLIPSEHSSGKRVLQGNITRLGDAQLRSLLIEAAWKAIKKNIHLQKFFDRIKNRNHSQIAKRKAIVAVARKLTLFIYAVLKEQRPFMVH